MLILRHRPTDREIKDFVAFLVSPFAIAEFTIFTWLNLFLVRLCQKSELFVCGSVRLILRHHPTVREIRIS